jgi:hypothetical protein
MPQIFHKDLDINEIITGRTHKDIKTGVESPIIRAILQNGLNKRDKNSGLFVPCDMGLTERIGDRNPWRVNEGRYGNLSFVNPSSLNKHEVTLQYESGTGIRLRYEGANCSFESITDNKPKFKAQKGVTIEHTPTYKGVAVVMVLDDPLNAPDSFKFSIEELGGGYTYKEVNGGILLDGPEPIMIHAPWAEDANGERGEVVLDLGSVEGGRQTIIKRIVDISWLRQAAAPVKVDPYFTIDGVSGTFIETLLSNFALNLDKNYGATPIMWTHRFVAGANESDILSNTDLTAYSGLGITILSGHLGATSSGRSGNGYNHKIHRILAGDWVDGTKDGTTAGIDEPCFNWRKFNTVPWDSEGCRTAGVDYQTIPESTTFVGSSGTHTFDLTPATLQDMIENPSTNYGFLWRTDDAVAGEYEQFYSSEGAGDPPFLKFEYTEGAEEVWHPNSYYGNRKIRGDYSPQRSRRIHGT